MRDDDFMAHGKCVGMDPKLFFPDEENRHDGKQRRSELKLLRATCASCLVNQQCLEYALKNKIKYGFWGGYSESDRRRRKYIKVVAA